MVFFIVCVDFQSPVRLVGHVHCSVEKFDVTNFVHAKRVSFDVVTYGFELDVNLVVEKDAHAVDRVAVYVSMNLAKRPSLLNSSVEVLKRLSEKTIS